MFNLIKCEMFKLRKSMPLKILFLLMFGLSIVTSLSSLSYVDSPLAEEMGVALNGYDAFFSSLRDLPTIAMIGIIVIGFIICNDFENRTIQTEISAGHSRAAILFSKIISLSIAYFVVYLPYPLGRAIFQGVLIKFASLVTAGMFIKMLAAFVSIILVGLALDSIIILLAFILRKSILVMGIGLLFVVLGGTAIMSFGVSNPAFGALLEKTPVGLFKALAIANYEPSALLQATIISLFCIGCVLCVTYALFRKAELK
jgi:ABC-2 type transport system permease protein